MNWTDAVEHWGEAQLLAACGLLLGLGFGFFAQRSRFCLRGAVIEFWHGRFGDKLAVWLLAFSSAVVGVQPFGGCGLSGTGPKAGGPSYLLRFVNERATSVNTTAVGGNASLLSLVDEE